MGLKRTRHGPEGTRRQGHLGTQEDAEAVQGLTRPDIERHGEPFAMLLGDWKQRPDPYA